MTGNSFGLQNLIGFTVGGQDITGILYSMPLWLLIGLGIAAIVGVFGILGRIRAILSGKGTGMDFILVIVILVIATLMTVLVTGHVIKRLGVF